MEALGPETMFEEESLMEKAGMYMDNDQMQTVDRYC